MSGGKGGSQTVKTELPKWLDTAAQDAVQRGQAVSEIGYMPWRGPDVAAMTPMQNAAFGNTNAAASAFGMPTAQGTGMPTPTTFAGGVQGYSSAPLYDQSLAQMNPKQYAMLLDLMPGMGPQPGRGGQSGTLTPPRGGIGGALSPVQGRR